MTRRRLIVSPRAEDDIEGYFLYLAADSLEVALRFLRAVEQTYESIARWPQSGSIRFVGNPEIAGLRSKVIQGFPNHLVFYRLPNKQTVRIIRVRHGAMDLNRVFRKRKRSS